MNNYSMGYGGGGENYLPPTGHAGHYSRYQHQQPQHHHHHQHQQNQNQIQIQPPRPQDGGNNGGGNFNFNNNANNYSGGLGQGQGHGGHNPYQDNNGHGHIINNNYVSSPSHGHHGHGPSSLINNNNNNNMNLNNNNNNNINNVSNTIAGLSDSGHNANLTNPWPLRCNNCPNFAEIFCPRCELVGYCSEVHLQEDEMNHRGNCWPEKNFTEISRCPESGEVLCVISGNNLGGGDSICKLRPLMMIPHDKNLPGPPNSSLCLGCCKWFVTGTYKCSVCHWPVCSIQCETNSLHATYECGIFHVANVSSSYFPGIYDVLLVLRCLLMLDSSSSSAISSVAHAHPADLMRQAFRDWSAWKGNPRNEKKILKVPPRLEEVAEKFLISICHVTCSMDKGSVPEFLREVMGFAYSNSLCQENRVSVYDSNHVRNYHSAKYVFGHKYAYTSHCSPNTSWTINYGPTLREANLHMWAISALKIGDKLTASFDPNFTEYGTAERRLLQRHFNSRACDGCERCADATEGKSMASAVRCRKCLQGFILPLCPLDLEDMNADLDPLTDLDPDPNDDTPDHAVPPAPTPGPSDMKLSSCGGLWRCSNEECLYEMEAKEVFKKFAGIADEINEGRACIGKLGRIVKKLKNHVLHPQHYLVARAADRIVELGWMEVQGKLFDNLKLYNFKPILAAANACLTFADAVAPGYTKLRAKYIYILQMLHGISLTHSAVRHFGKDEFVEGRLIRLKFEKIFLYQKEFHRIAQHEKVGSCLYDWLQVLLKCKDDLGELLRTTTGKRAFDGYELERLKRAFSYFCPEMYEPNLPPELHVDVTNIVFFIDPTPFRPEYKTFFGFQ